jgi:hypothetical protein
VGSELEMRAIKVKYNGEVFVPLEPIRAKHIKEAMVIIVLSDEEELKLAYEEYKEKYPEGDVEWGEFRYFYAKP